MAAHNTKPVNLALQGGGAHGAYAWGVLDRFTEDGRLVVDGLCATSAGAMNASVFAYGLMEGGADGAREALYRFWAAVSDAGRLFSPVKGTPLELLISGWDLDDSLSFASFEAMTRVFSPYDLNPFDFNPLREILDRHVDFEKLVHCDCVKLFISATNVHSGKVRVFYTPEVTLDVVMASACLPFLFKAVEINGEHYWDGGYMGNPALFPLFYDTDTRDVIIIHINPLEREELPKRATDIMNRLNEISFNSSLLKEMRAIAFVQRLLEEGWLKDEYRDRLKHILLHSIGADRYLCDLSVASKFDPDWHFLTELRDRGREAAGEWLDRNFKRIGRESTVDLRREFLDIGGPHAG